jgi:hypothetical protein
MASSAAFRNRNRSSLVRLSKPSTWRELASHHTPSASGVAVSVLSNPVAAAGAGAGAAAEEAKEVEER